MRNKAAKAEDKDTGEICGVPMMNKTTFHQQGSSKASGSVLPGVGGIGFDAIVETHRQPGHGFDPAPAVLTGPFLPVAAEIAAATENLATK
jgi:hypothetical protein